MKHIHKWKFDRDRVVFHFGGWACKCKCGAREYVDMKVENFDEDDQIYLTTTHD